VLPKAIVRLVEAKEIVLEALANVTVVCADETG
jgi:hypothetical protein